MKVSEFFNSKDINPFLMGAFFSRYIFSDDKTKIYTNVSFKSSKYENFKLKGYTQKYLKILNKVCSPYSHWKTVKESETSFQARFILENDLNLKEKNFFNRLYTTIVSKENWFLTEELNEAKKSFIRGFLEPRGSIDTCRRYITQDYFYNSIFEIKRARLLIDYFSVPYSILNLNFRDLQNDYTSGKNLRNTQLRINADWVMKNIGMYNKYKAGIFEKAFSITDSYEKQKVFYFNTNYSLGNRKSTFDERLNYYSTNIYGQKIPKEEIAALRKNLGFDSKKNNIRNPELVELIRLQAPDECVCCKDKYNIKDRSFTHKKTGKFYFEIHHAISLGTKIELDDENNLVKVCPVCHTCLKKGIGTEEEQKHLITMLLQNAPQVFEFAKHIFDTEDFSTVVQKMYENLK